MTDLIDIIPRTSTPLERAAVQTVDSRSRYQADVHQTIDVRYAETIAANLLPWLLRHWGLEDAATYMPDQQRMYKDGKCWQSARGRVAAYSMIFDWLGLNGIYEKGDHGDFRWGLFQLGLDAEPSKQTIINLVGLADLSKRASSVLGRVYGGYDIRPARADDVKYDDCLWDDWSGVYVDGIAPKLSFGRQWGEAIDLAPDLQGGSTTTVSGVGRFEEGFVYDESITDEVETEPLVVAIQASLSSEIIDIAKDVLMPWPNAPWPNVSWTQFPPFTIYGGPESGSTS
jgi:hypothetical protein